VILELNFSEPFYIGHLEKNFLGNLKAFQQKSKKKFLKICIFGPFSSILKFVLVRGQKQ